MMSASAPTRLTLLAARWAAELQLPIGNHWEPALVRHMSLEVARLGGDASAYAFVEATTAIRLNLSV